MDTVQKANSGHPGLPLGMAPAAYLLFQRIMRFNPRDPHWPDRDRFVLSAGHGSALLYVMLHLSRVRRLARGPEGLPPVGLDHAGPPRARHGPRHAGRRGHDRPARPGLRQRRRHGDGRALPARALRQRRSRTTTSSRSSPTATSWRASPRRPPRSPGTCASGGSSTSTTTTTSRSTGRRRSRFKEDVDEALRGLRLACRGGRGRQRPRRARAGDRPRDAGRGAPVARARALDHRLPVAEQAGHERRPRRAARRGRGAPHEGGDGPRSGRALRRAGRRRRAPRARSRAARRCRPSGSSACAPGATRTRRGPRSGIAAWAGKPLPGIDAALPPQWSKDGLATRVAGKEAMAAFAPFVPTMVGGAADLSSSTNTLFPGGESEHYTAHAGRAQRLLRRPRARDGRRRQRPRRPRRDRAALRLDLPAVRRTTCAARSASSALMGLSVTWVYTHDSVGLGEDGPTHQPVEHLAALRAIPQLTVIRPGDPDETAEAWRVTIEQLDGPVAMALSRQGTTVLGRGANGVASAAGLARGAYVLRDAENARASVIGTGTEVGVAVGRRRPAQRRRHPDAGRLDARAGSCSRPRTRPTRRPRSRPSCRRSPSRRGSRWAGSAGSTRSSRSTASALRRPGGQVLEKLGITPEAVVDRVKTLLG